MNYNITHEPSTDPGLVAAAEQEIASIAEADRLAPDNGEMVENSWVDELIRWNLRGQPTWLREFDTYMPDSDGIAAPHVAVVVASPLGYAPAALGHEVPEDGGPVTRALAASCVLCGDPYRANANYRSFWIACGRTILEVNLCGVHAKAFMDWYSAVPKEPTYAAV
ncbi:MAG: hypothetical protein KF680_11135 [Cryobacterium sp.]|nr:hypothetical protein [Cryobacterium sp.]